MLENPVRKSVPEAILTCRRAGIKVVLTSGDHPRTSLAIARTVGIVLGGTGSGNGQFTSIQMANNEESSKEDVILEESTERTVIFGDREQKNLYTGEDLAKLSDHHLSAFLASSTDLVFARVSPTDKHRLVRLMQQCKQVGSHFFVRFFQLKM